MNDLIEDIIEAGAEQPVPTEEALEDLANFVWEYKKLLIDLTAADDRVTNLNKEIMSILTAKIPEKLRSIGLESFKMTDGSEVQLNTVYSAHISEERKNKAHEWLRDNGHGDLIKNELKLGFGKGEDLEAQAVKDFLDQREIAYAAKEAVNPMTLKAFVKEQLQGQKALPSELLGVHVQDVAKVVPPKKKKEKAK